ncbi:MAG: SPOR domain-containing protein [Pseudomonadota bacterium]
MSSTGPEFNPSMEPVEPVASFDVERSSDRAGLLKLVIGFCVLVTLIFIAIKVYQPGVRDRGDPPLITAENTPFKIVPENTEGFQTPDQDKEVFDVMSGEEPSTDVVTLPMPERPMNRPEADSVPDSNANDPESTGDTPDVETTPANVTRNDPEPVVETPVTQAPAPAPIRNNDATLSDWVVQVASLRSQAEADAAYTRIETAVTPLLSRYNRDVVRVDLGDRGIYYRARVAGFSTRDDASALCDQLKAAGQSCFVARR